MIPGILKGTLHSKLAVGSFSWPKSMYYFDLSLTSFTFVKLEFITVTLENLTGVVALTW